MPARLRATRSRTTIIGFISSGFFSASEKSPSHGGIVSGLEGGSGETCEDYVSLWKASSCKISRVRGDGNGMYENLQRILWRWLPEMQSTYVRDTRTNFEAEISSILLMRSSITLLAADLNGYTLPEITCGWR